MRNGQKRMRGRSGGGGGGGGGGNNNQHRKSQNPLTRVYESNGPDVKIRGTASHIAEKYIQLARDSQSSGDPVAAENYYQHAEHYFRLIAAAQEQFRQQNPYYNNQANPQGQQAAPQGAADDNFDDDDDGQPFAGQNEPGFAPQPQAPQHVPQAQPYLPRDAQPFPPRDQQQHRPQPQPQHQPYVQPVQGGNAGGNTAAPDVGGLPAFITGGGQPQPNIAPNADGPNGHDQGGQDRFGHRRRRRHRSGGNFNNRPDNFGNVAPQGAAPSVPNEGGDEPRQPD
jgi:Domain of unknown function (DUF4167)